MDKQLQQLNKLLGAMDTSAMSQEEIIKGFELIIKHVEENKDLTRREIEAIRQAYEEMLAERRNAQIDYENKFNELKNNLTQAVEQKLKTVRNGKDGRDGRDGRDGIDGIDGKDGVDGRNGKDGKDGKDGVNGTNGGRPGWGAHPLQILDGSTVVDKVARVINFGTNLTATRSASGVITVNASGGSGFSELTATGTVNGTNTSFTFTQQPTYIVSDGVWYKVNKGWTWSNPTATMSVPPNDDIYGVA